MKYLLLIFLPFSFKTILSQTNTSDLYTRNSELFAGTIYDYESEGDSIISDDNNPSWFNEYTISGNYNDIARYTTNANRGGFGFGCYHNSKEFWGFALNVGAEINYTSYYGRLVLPHANASYWYGPMDASLTAFSIPATMRYYAGNRFRVFPEWGAFIDLNALAVGRGKELALSGNQPHYTVVAHDITTTVQLKRINYGLIIGLGFHVPIGDSNIILKAEYRYGERELTRESSIPVGVYNRYFRFSAGYALGLRKNSSANKATRMVSELRFGLNYGATIIYYKPLYRENYIEKSQLGFGLSVNHLSSEKKNFQFILGLESDLLRMASENKYTRAYNGKVEETQSNSQVQNLYLSLNSGFRYSIGHRKIRPFAQIGLAPELMVIHDKEDNFVLNNLTTGEIKKYNYKNNVIKLWDIALVPNFGLGMVIKSSKVDYVVLVDYKNTLFRDYYSVKARPEYFRLSLGVQLHNSE